MTSLVLLLFVQLRSWWLFTQISLAVKPLLYYDIGNNKWGLWRFFLVPMRIHHFLPPLSHQFWTHGDNARAFFSPTAVDKDVCQWGRSKHCKVINGGIYRWFYITYYRVDHVGAMDNMKALLDGMPGNFFSFMNDSTS